MRQTVIALRLADLVGTAEADRQATYYLGLMVNAYCHADAAEQAAWFGDDIGFKADAFELLGMDTLQMVAFVLRAEVLALLGRGQTDKEIARLLTTTPQDRLEPRRAHLREARCDPPGAGRGVRARRTESGRR